MGIMGFKLVLSVILSIVVLGALGSAEDAFAIDRLSNGAGGGAWNDPGTWALGVIPTAADRAIVVAGDTVTLTGAGIVDITQVKGTLNINGGVLITTPGVGSDFTITPTGTVNNNAGIGIIADDIRIDGGIFNNNAGGTLTVTNNVQVFGGATLNNFGTILADELFVYDAGSTGNNDGSIVVANEFRVGSFAGAPTPGSVFNNNPTGTITGTGLGALPLFDVRLGSTITNAGTINWDSGLTGIGIGFLGTFTNTGTGIMTVTGTADWVVSNAASFFNACGGVMSTADDFRIHNAQADNNGLLTIGGDLVLAHANADIINDGVVSIAGANPGFTDNGNSCAAAGPVTASSGGSGDDTPGSAKPTLGKVKNGFLAVEGGFCFNLYCVDVLDYFNHLELQQVGSNDSFTITLTGYFPAGSNRANYASIGAAPPGGDINDSLWTVMAKRVGATDQWEVMTNDEGGNLGAVTVTVQKVDNNIVSFAFTIQSHTPASIGTPEGDVEPSEDNLILVTDLRDNRGNSVRNIFNEGFFVNDPYAYPEVQADFEASLEVDKLCLNEDSTDRNTCAFDKVKDWSIVQAEQTLAEMYGEGFQGDFAESEQYD